MDTVFAIADVRIAIKNVVILTFFIKGDNHEKINQSRNRSNYLLRNLQLQSGKIVMEKTVVVGTLMALALLGMTFVEFVFTCTVCIGIGAVIFYMFLICAKFADKMIDLLYEPR